MSPSLDCAARVAVSCWQGHHIHLSQQLKSRLRTAIGGVSYLFCLGLVLPGLAQALGSDFQARWEVEFVSKQSSMNRLSLCVLGLILIRLDALEVFVSGKITNSNGLNILIFNIETKHLFFYYK